MSRISILPGSGAYFIKALIDSIPLSVFNYLSVPAGAVLRKIIVKMNRLRGELQGVTGHIRVVLQVELFENFDINIIFYPLDHSKITL